MVVGGQRGYSKGVERGEASALSGSREGNGQPGGMRFQPGDRRGWGGRGGA